MLLNTKQVARWTGISFRVHDKVDVAKNNNKRMCADLFPSNKIRWHLSEKPFGAGLAMVDDATNAKRNGRIDTERMGCIYSVIVREMPPFQVPISKKN